MIDHLRRAAELADGGIPFVAVTVIEATGSTPTVVGARILVLGSGLDAGTVGGGRVEAKAIGHAQKLLIGSASPETVRWNLKRDVGMTCGGTVGLLFEPVGVASWPIVVFGAGHVTQALARVLAPMPCQVTCIDPRSDWLERLPEGVQRLLSADPAREAADLPENASVLCMTRGHGSDLPVLEAILKGETLPPYLGVIGSRSKAAVLRKELTERGVAADRVAFECPIGLPIGSNHPAEIAVSIAAQLLEHRDRHRRLKARDADG